MRSLFYMIESQVKVDGLDGRDFQQWLHMSKARFPDGYVAVRLDKEKYKADFIISKEGRFVSKLVNPKNIVNFILKLSGLQNRGLRNANAIRLNRNKLVISKLPKAFYGYKILQLSDLHFNHKDGLSEQVLEILKQTEFDLCVLTGDYRYRSFGSSDLAINGLRHLRNVIDTDIISILGNHDSIRTVPVMEALGITVLLNEHKVIEHNDAQLIIAGVDDPSYYQTDNLDYSKLHMPLTDSTASILLAHSPDLFEAAEKLSFGGYLCGHTHGGQICITPGKALYKNCRSPDWSVSGAWTYKSISGYTSVGVGTSVVNARFNCVPEITLHELV